LSQTTPKIFIQNTASIRFDENAKREADLSPVPKEKKKFTTEESFASAAFKGFV